MLATVLDNFSPVQNAWHETQYYGYHYSVRSTALHFLGVCEYYDITTFINTLVEEERGELSRAETPLYVW